MLKPNFEEADGLGIGSKKYEYGVLENLFCFILGWDISLKNVKNHLTYISIPRVAHKENMEL